MKYGTESISVLNMVTFYDNLSSWSMTSLVLYSISVGYSNNACLRVRLMFDKRGCDVIAKVRLILRLGSYCTAYGVMVALPPHGVSSKT